MWIRANGGPLALVVLGLALTGFTTDYGWIFVAVGVGWWVWAHLRKKPESEPTSKSPTQPRGMSVETEQTAEVSPRSASRAGRTFVDVDPSYLVGLFDEHTNIQARRLIEPYIGKWLRVSDRVTNVSTWTHGDVVAVSIESSPIVLIFDRDAWADRLAVLLRGSPISAVGEISNVDEGGVTVENCELLEGGA